MQPTAQQLDIFADSRDVMLRNDVLERLQRRDARAARTALEMLVAEYPDDGALAAMSVLVGELERAPTAPPFADHVALATDRGVTSRMKWCPPRDECCPRRRFTPG